MKHMFLLFTVIFTINSFSQVISEIDNNQISFKCDDIIKVNSDDGDIIELIGNVDFKTNLVEFINADKIVYNNSTKNVLVFGMPDKILLQGTVARIMNKPKYKTIRYKIGDNMIYIY